ncbi:MAG: PorT family protein [Saprospiraceae bacterium]|nr:PorT family protein [Saprospiraceae bacterium]
MTLHVSLARLLYFLLPVCWISCVPFASAQHYLGLTGGGGFSPTVGFRAGVVAEWKHRPNVVFLTEATYLQRTSPEILRKLDRNRGYHLATVDYVSLNFLIKMQLDLEPVGLYAVAGADISFGARAYARYSSDGNIVIDRLLFDELALRRWDAGVCIGGGIEKEIRKRRRIFFDVRYYLGIIDIDKDTAGDIFNEGTFFNLGFLIPL